MKIFGVEMQDRTALIIGGVGLVIGYSIYKKTSDTLSGAADYLTSNFKNPVDALLANIGILPDSVTQSNTAPTRGFAEYIKSMGGIDEYIAKHKNGTFTGKPYNPNEVVAPSWYDIFTKF